MKKPENKVPISIFYPPAQDYHWMFQRPQHMMHGFARRCREAYFFHNVYKFRVTRNLNIDGLVITEDLGPGKLKRPRVMYCSAPQCNNFLSYYSPNLFVFDVVDLPSESFSSWKSTIDPSILRSDVLLCTSDKLKEYCADLGREATIIPNGVDYEKFSVAETLCNDLVEYKNLRRPVFYFHGAIARWGKWDMIKEIAKELPAATFLIVGDVFGARFENLPKNIKWIGHQPYNKLHRFLSLADVCFIPFDESSPLIEACNPIKVWEYFASGKPVVSTKIRELTNDPNVRKLIYFGNTKSEFKDAMIQAYTEVEKDRRTGKFGIKHNQRREIAKNNSWDSNSAIALKVIVDELRRRNLVPKNFSWSAD